MVVKVLEVDRQGHYVSPSRKRTLTEAVAPAADAVPSPEAPAGISRRSLKKPTSGLVFVVSLEWDPVGEGALSCLGHDSHLRLSGKCNMSCWASLR